MTVIKRFFNETIAGKPGGFLPLIFVFASVNWLLLSMIEKIGPPDFYKMHAACQKIASGDLNIGIVPPLFPLLLYPLGKLIGLFMEQKSAFLLAGRLIALVSSTGVLYFTYRFLEKITGKFAIAGVVFMAVSPWYLKLLSFPITDMLYLFFASAVFYLFLVPEKSWWMRGFFIACGALTRFEGVLLVMSTFINYLKFKKRSIYILLAASPLVGLLLLFFAKFSPRFFAHMKDIVLAKKTYLFIFQHPLEYLNLFYGNILHFIPASYPSVLKWLLLVIVIAFFAYGIYRLFKINKNLTFALLAYEFFFLLAKGYLNVDDPGREFRRIFSGLWIFYIIAFIGLYFLLEKIKNSTLVKQAALVLGGFLFAVLAGAQGLQPLRLSALGLILVVPLLLSLNTRMKEGKHKYVFLVLTAVFFLQIYGTAFKKATNYVDSYANKAAYAAALWLNLTDLKPGTTVLSYTNNVMVEYYLKENKEVREKFTLVHFTVPMRNTPDNKGPYTDTFFQLLKEHQVDYIIFDNYVVHQPEFLGINDVQKLLYEEQKNKRLFRFKKDLFYKGQSVGYVLKPIHINAQTNN
ncbi:MAG: hypothetical protein GY765_26885 [bacterium]|nr:hypothetical protein [bacterium]